ncbi:uncharacterized protein SCHCODRAFT_01101025 [Schizophyllum commune H4-8]|uniref:Fungal calcium binding protein domain-containing protein n=1 Tax=Schizophyllum commune (strain H4-8 / FGSC 9210) TaxID=578458 RepID=D8QCK1_SCHCM|nr:uncharacterized protein SCHCODRAFT_01101025 [Schizophyllum commune H4-8]KAI5889616.1 hypothetical protein SCHCODRAFT_01101025 [Schizophyllum commune H4-8]
MKLSFTVFTAALAAVAYASADVDATELVRRDRLVDHISCPLVCNPQSCLGSLAPSVATCGAALATAGANIFADISCLTAAVKTVTSLPDSCKQCLDEFGL